MHAIDICLAIILVLALIKGFRDGIVVQVCGIAGLLLGAWLAYHFGRQAGAWIGLEGNTAVAVGFVLILIGTLLVLALAGRVVRGIFHLAGLGIVDKIGGALLSIIKTGFVLSLLLSAFTWLNLQYRWVEEPALQRSRLYGPVLTIREIVFPYLEPAADKILQQTGLQAHEHNKNSGQ